MKIAHVIWSLGTGGSESMLVDILNEQSKTQKIYLLVINDVVDGSLIDSVSKNVECHFIKRNPGSNNPIPIVLYNYILTKIKPDIIHCHNDSLAKITLVEKLLSCKLLLTVHNTKVKKEYLKHFDTIFSISTAVENDIKTKSGISSITINNGIRVSDIKLKQDYSFGIFRIVQVGRLFIQDKGQDILLKAIAILIHKFNIKNITVDFIGEGESRDYLLSLANELEISSYCTFLRLKDRDYVYNHINEYNLLVQPSRSEGFGLTVAEAMAARLPVLISDIEGPMEIIDRGKFGYFFESCNSQQCAEMLHDIINQYNSKVMEMKVEKGLIHVAEMYSINKTAQDYIDNYIN